MVVDPEQIRATLHKTFDTVGPVTVHANGVVDVKWHIRMVRNMPRMPVQFGTVGGDFHCKDCDLETLWGSPHTVSGEYNCTDNKNTDLKFSPVRAGSLACGGEQLTSLEGLSAELSSVVVKYFAHIPLLRLLSFDDITVYTDPYGEIFEPVQSILDKYKNVGNGKKNIIACAVALNNAHFGGNARW